MNYDRLKYTGTRFPKAPGTVIGIFISCIQHQYALILKKRILQHTHQYAHAGTPCSGNDIVVAIFQLSV